MVLLCYFFFFNDTATTEIYTLSLHDALPILKSPVGIAAGFDKNCEVLRPASYVFGFLNPGSVLKNPNIGNPQRPKSEGDRKSTRLNSSHANISYAVFCLKKKKKIITYLSQHT